MGFLVDLEDEAFMLNVVKPQKQNDFIIVNNKELYIELENISAEMSTPDEEPTTIIPGDPDQQETTEDLTKTLPNKKKYVRPLPAFMRKEQVIKVLEQLEFDQSRHLFATLLWVTGVRVTELLNITPTHCDFERKELRVLWQKSRVLRERYVTVPDDVMLRLEEYTAHTEANERIFPFTRSWAHNFLKRAQLEAGLKLARYGPHSFRHSFGTYLKQSGKPLENISEALGHSDLRPTQIYAHIDGSEHKKAVEGIKF